MADTNTIGRIGGILKNVYGPGIHEQQNLTPALRKRFSKAKGVRMGGDHLELSVRVGGNRAGVAAMNSDDALPTPRRQNEQKFQIFDRFYAGVIRLYDKDIENAKSNEQAFISHLDDEVNQIVKDILKCQNIDTFMDGTGILGTVNAGTVNTNTFVGKTGTAFGSFGTRYLQGNDQIDIFDSTLVTQRTPAGGLQVTAINTGNQTITISGNLTLTGGDVVVRANSVNKPYVGLQLADDNAAVSFQSLSRSTYPILKGNVLSASGNALSEDHLQQILSLIRRASGEQPDMFVSGDAQWDAYVKLGQSLKRYQNTNELDRGFTELDYNGIPFVYDVDAPPAIIHALNTQYVQNGVVTPLSWAEADGSQLKWDPGFAAWKAWMREYGNYVYPRPNALGRIEALSVPSAYVV